MLNHSKKLLLELEIQLQTINTEDNFSILEIEEVINLILAAIEKLKELLNTNTFVNKAEEIEFFKTVKPSFTSKLIYFQKMYRIETSKPIGTKKELQKQYRKEVKKLTRFFNKNKEFYKYFRTENTSFDNKYFLRNKLNVKLICNNHLFTCDKKFNTSHDYLMAKVIASELLQTYLIKKLNPTENKSIENKTNEKLKWTGSKVAIVELMYALYNEKVINNGNTSLNEIAKNIEEIFNIDMGQFNRIYLEIKDRKTIQKTQFLDTLRTNLNKRIEDANN
ncbi:RteC domain-containing protein [Flavobacterium sp. SUN052]|uniref:RteC domain-containing protein n=1 Tax=Flavobacterium sp. SUN052 TaxID=3002441 RepID=UPI00237EB8A6|nr:RteC domain-containing protein [Flavobacterium sp. SUN052]MEC4004846.1 RteC domain-containing protein [Flavobacterium sp. SUN052]